MYIYIYMEKLWWEPRRGKSKDQIPVTDEMSEQFISNL
jgi:hypothetical protein